MRIKAYYRSRVVEGADVESFEIIADKLARDKNHYFYNGWKVDDADYSSFTSVKNDSDGSISFLDCKGAFSPQRKRIGKFKGYKTSLVREKKSSI